MLNCSTYLFGVCSSGYFQYPMDSQSSRLMAFSTHSGSESQITVYRERNLMYYAYIRNIDSADFSHFIGICVLVNGMGTYNILSLFRLFESTVQNMAIDGRVLSINRDGMIQISGSVTANLQTEQNHVSNLIQKTMSEGEKYFERMPPVNYSSASDDCPTVSVSDGEREIRTLIDTYNTVCITKDRSLSGPAFNGVSLKIRHLYDELRLEKERNAELEQILKRQKVNIRLARFGKVLIVILILIMAVSIYMLRHQLILLNFHIL